MNRDVDALAAQAYAEACREHQELMDGMPDGLKTEIEAERMNIVWEKLDRIANTAAWILLIGAPLIWLFGLR